MNHSDFRIGAEFSCDDKSYRCTDVGTRTIAAIRVDQVEVAGNGGVILRTLNKDQAEDEGWFRGPPYAVLERLFDEDDFPICEPTS